MENIKIEDPRLAIKDYYEKSPAFIFRLLHDVQYIIKHKDRETAEESVTALSEVADAFLAIAQSIDENK
jgi:hypothetical protein